MGMVMVTIPMFSQEMEQNGKIVMRTELGTTRMPSLLMRMNGTIPTRMESEIMRMPFLTTPSSGRTLMGMVTVTMSINSLKTALNG